MTTTSYDIVIVGAGTAGIPCALAAADAGASVLLVEKDSQIGGTLHITGGHLSAAGTKRQAEKGIDDNPQQHFEDIRRLNNGTSREDIVERAVNLAPAMLDWLHDNGFDFTPESPERPHEHEAYSVARSYTGVEGGLSILRILQEHLTPALEAGKIELRTSTHVIGLVQQDDGTVTGVQVMDKSGKEEQIDAGAVVLATGGYGANPELFEELENRPLVSSARLTSTGDGLIFAREAGAAIQGQGKHMPTFGGLIDAKSSWRSPVFPRATLNADLRAPWEIYVDKHGDRFVAEDSPGSDAKERALYNVDDMRFWVVMDERAVLEAGDLIPGMGREQLHQMAAENPGFHVADTIEELAEQAGINPAGLAATVARYNDALAHGTPDEFGREVRPAPIAQAPFYAIRNHGVVLVVFSGVDVDADLAVRREDGSVIPGLYAVGEILGNGATAGNAFCSGMQVTPALTLGRWLGGHLAQRS